MPDIVDLTSMYEEAENEVQIGNHDKAILLLNKVIESCEVEPKLGLLRPHKAEELHKLLALAFNNRGHIKYLRVDFDEAVEDYTRAIRENKELAVAYYNRGLIHYRLARFQEAAADQDRALSIQPDFTSARSCLEQCQREISTADTKSS